MINGIAVLSPTCCLRSTILARLLILIRLGIATFLALLTLYFLPLCGRGLNKLPPLALSYQLFIQVTSVVSATPISLAIFATLILFDFLVILYSKL